MASHRKSNLDGQVYKGMSKCLRNLLLDVYPSEDPFFLPI